MPPMHVRRWIQTTGNMYLGCRMLDAAPSLITTVSRCPAPAWQCHEAASVFMVNSQQWSYFYIEEVMGGRRFFSVLEADNIFEGHTNALYCSLVSANSKMFVKAWWLWLSAAMTHANIGRSWDLLDWADNRQVARDQLQTREVARAENICEMLKIFGET